MLAAVALWDMDAMRPHVAAHSWLTLAYVSIFLIEHMVSGISLGSISFGKSLKALYDALPIDEVDTMIENRNFVNGLSIL